MFSKNLPIKPQGSAEIQPSSSQKPQIYSYMNYTFLPLILAANSISTPRRKLHHKMQILR